MDVPSICREQNPGTFRHDSKSNIPLREGGTRLEDYLNDKIQTRADLASLASLMENVELQKKQLEDQVSSCNC
jgi:RAD50-interacting protein 1